MINILKKVRNVSQLINQYGKTLRYVRERDLVRYEYSERGELTAVYDRAGVKVREFEYHPDFLGRMSSHAYAGRPTSQYTYDQSGRVIQQINPFGITY